MGCYHERSSWLSLLVGPHSGKHIHLPKNNLGFNCICSYVHVEANKNFTVSHCNKLIGGIAGWVMRTFGSPLHFSLLRGNIIGSEDVQPFCASAVILETTAFLIVVMKLAH